MDQLVPCADGCGGGIFLVEPYLVELIKADWFPVIVENLPCCGMQYRCELTLVVTRMVNGDSGEAPFKNELFSIV